MFSRLFNIVISTVSSLIWKSERREENTKRISNSLKFRNQFEQDWGLVIGDW